MSTPTAKKVCDPTTVLRLMAEERRDQQRGDRIARLMDAQGWGPSDLARVVNVDRKRIYGWRSGENIDSAFLERLAIALETTRLFIESGEGSMNVPRNLPPALLAKQLAEAQAEQEAKDG